MKQAQPCRAVTGETASQAVQIWQLSADWCSEAENAHQMSIALERPKAWPKNISWKTSAAVIALPLPADCEVTPSPRCQLKADKQICEPTCSRAPRAHRESWGSSPLCPERNEGSWRAVLPRDEDTAVWLTLGTGCSAKWGTRFSVISPILRPSCNSERSCCLFGSGGYRLFKVLPCLLREQTYEVSRAFIWCRFFLPWKMGNSLLICTPQKLAGITDFLAQKSTSELTMNTVKKDFSWLFFQRNAHCHFPCWCLPLCTL